MVSRSRASPICSRTDPSGKGPRSVGIEGEEASSSVREVLFRFRSSRTGSTGAAGATERLRRVRGMAMSPSSRASGT